MSKKQRLDQCIGNYRLRRLLSRSHTTEIYLAEHTLFHTEAAVKLLDGCSADDEIKKFLAQATLLTQLQHPHIVHVLDFGIVGARLLQAREETTLQAREETTLQAREETILQARTEETAFLIMNYAANGTLRQHYPKGTRLPVPRVLHYVRQIASALHYVHQHHLIHRDIKPHNMLLGTNDDVMLTDFNIAVVAQDFASNTPAFRDFEGTVPYAAPEQLQGRPQKSSDLYALGIVVYEWLCGEWPFSGSFDEIVHQHLFIPPPSLREKQVEVPPAFEQAIRKALAKEPEQRFSAVEDFVHALELAYLPAQQPVVIPEIPLTLSSRRQFMSPLPFTGEAVINQAG